MCPVHNRVQKCMVCRVNRLITQNYCRLRQISYKKYKTIKELYLGWKLPAHAIPGLCTLNIFVYEISLSCGKFRKQHREPLFGHGNTFDRGLPMDEGIERDKTWGRGAYLRCPVFTTVLQYNSAFATRVLLSTNVCVKWEKAWGRIFKLLRTPSHRFNWFFKRTVELDGFLFIWSYLCRWFKGTVSREFLLLVFFLYQFPPSLWLYH